MDANKERLMRQGLLMERREELRRLANRVRGIIGSLSDATFVLDKSQPWDIDGERVADYARELKEALSSGRRLREQIAELEASLGSN